MLCCQDLALAQEVLHNRSRVRLGLGSPCSPPNPAAPHPPPGPAVVHHPACRLRENGCSWGGGGESAAYPPTPRVTPVGAAAERAKPCCSIPAPIRDGGGGGGHVCRPDPRQHPNPPGWGDRGVPLPGLGGSVHGASLLPGGGVFGGGGRRAGGGSSLCVCVSPPTPGRGCGAERCRTQDQAAAGPPPSPEFSPPPPGRGAAPYLEGAVETRDL